MTHWPGKETNEYLNVICEVTQYR